VVFWRRSNRPGGHLEKEKRKELKERDMGAVAFVSLFFHNERDIDGAENYIRDRKTVS
jgi:hypothetical protein